MLYFYDNELFDKYVSMQQRKDLSLCEECGGVFLPSNCTLEACPCKDEWRLQSIKAANQRSQSLQQQASPV